MARGTSLRLGLLTSSSTADTLSTQDFLNDNTQLEALAAVAVQGARSARPAPGVPQRLYKATDTGELFWDTGTQWLYASGTFASSWVGDVRHSSVNRNLVQTGASSHGNYSVENGRVIGGCTVRLAENTPGADYVAMSLPVPPAQWDYLVVGNFAFRPVNITTANPQQTGTLVVVVGSTLVAPLSANRPSTGAAGQLTVDVNIGDVLSWSFSYLAG